MSNIIQVSNIAATVTDENIKTLFGFVGPIRETIIYFEDSQQEETKVAYVVYESNNDAETSLHLHNTVFHDRALIVLPLADCCNGQIPDINYAKVIRAPDKTVTGIQPKSKNWPRDVISMVVGRTGEQSIITIEPNFIKQGLPSYPKLPYSTEVAKIDEIRRTVLVTNLDSSTSAQQVLDFFQPVAEVKFIRMAGAENDNAAYVEFSEQSAVVKAFGMMGTNLNNRPIMIQHSNVAIVKPTNYLRNLEESSGRRKRDSKSINGRSRSKDRRRSKSKKRSRSRKRSRSKRRSRSKKRTPSRSRKRSKSRSRRRSHSKSRRSKSRSRNRKTKKRSRSRSKDRKRRSRSRDHKQQRDRSRSRHRKGKKRSRSKQRESDGDVKHNKKSRRDDTRDSRDKERERDKDKEKQRDKKKKSDKHREEKSEKHREEKSKNSERDNKEKSSKRDEEKKEKTNNQQLPVNGSDASDMSSCQETVAIKHGSAGDDNISVTNDKDNNNITSSCNNSSCNDADV